MKIPSTINTGVLDQYPLVELVSGYRVDKHQGSGCFMDPPGYPTYFLQHVYNAQGNSPAKGPELVLFGRELRRAERPFVSWDASNAEHDAMMRSLYRPLPPDHPRVEAWLTRALGYFGRGILDKPGDRSVDKTRFVTPFEFKLATLGKEALGVPFLEGDLMAKGLPIRSFSVACLVLDLYPDWPEDDLRRRLANGGAYGSGGPGDWWERHDEPFTPDTCPGLFGRQHPASGTWCQMCGWTKS